MEKIVSKSRLPFGIVQKSQMESVKMIGALKFSFKRLFTRIKSTWPSLDFLKVLETKKTVYCVKNN